jgi:hypothetical protein
MQGACLGTVSTLMDKGFAAQGSLLSAGKCDHRTGSSCRAGLPRQEPGGAASTFRVLGYRWSPGGMAVQGLGVRGTAGNRTESPAKTRTAPGSKSRQPSRIIRSPAQAFRYFASRVSYRSSAMPASSAALRWEMVSAVAPFLPASNCELNSARRLALVHRSWSQLSPCRGPAPKERCSLRNRWTACRFLLIRKLRAFQSRRLAWTSAATSSTITYSRLFVVALVHLARAVGVTNMLGLSLPLRG